MIHHPVSRSEPFFRPGTQMLKRSDTNNFATPWQVHTVMIPLIFPSGLGENTVLPCQPPVCGTLSGQPEQTGTAAPGTSACELQHSHLELRASSAVLLPQGHQAVRKPQLPCAKSMWEAMGPHREGPYQPPATVRSKKQKIPSQNFPDKPLPTSWTGETERDGTRTVAVDDQDRSPPAFSGRTTVSSKRS